MDEIDKLVLPDKNIIPDEKLLSSLLGDKMKLWLKLLDEVSARFKDSSGSWNYHWLQIISSDLSQILKLIWL